MTIEKGESSLPKLLPSKIWSIPNVAISVFCQQRPLECPQNEVISLFFKIHFLDLFFWHVSNASDIIMYNPIA